MANDMSIGIEQGIGKPQPRKVAERWLRARRIQRPQESKDGVAEGPTPLVDEAYDLFVERQELRDRIVGSERQIMEPSDSNQISFAAISTEWDDLISGRNGERIG